MRLDLSHANLQPLDFSTPSTLPALLNHYFAPLQPYQAIASSLYGTDIVEQTGEVEYPLWQIRQAFLATIRWHQAFDKALETVSRSSHTVKSDEEATQAAVELAIAKVLKQTLAHPKAGLNDYSGCSDSLDTLITWVTQITPHQQVPPHHADNLIYALSLLITLGLRDSTQGSLRRHILSFLKGEKVTLSFKVKNSTHTTTELTLNPKLIMRDLMFIDFRYTYWSTLNLDGIEFSGADFTGAFFVGSQNLTKARYCCFYKIHDERLHLKKSADLEGTQASPDVQSKQHRKHYFWGLSNLYQASLETDSSEKKKKLTQAAQLLKTTKKVFFHKFFIFKMHLALLALLRNRHKEAIHLLLTAWNLDAQALNTIVHSKPHHPPPYLNLLGWDVFKEHLKKVITRQQLRSFYIQLSEKPLTKNHRQNNTHKTTQSNASILEYATSPAGDSQRQCYLAFVQALWPEQTTLYEDLCNYPNPYGYRQSERSAYETLAASIQRLCRSPQSDDNKSLDTEHVNQDKALPSIEIRCHSVGNQRLLPSIVQKLVEHKLLDINTGEFKPPQKKKRQAETIISQHRVIRIDCDAHGVYLSSEPDVPRHTNTLESGYVSLHLKIHPDLPMMDYTTDIFNRRLIGHGSPANEFVVLTVIQEAIDNQSAYHKRYPVLISQTVEGMNLKHVLANHPEQLEYLDNKSTSEFFIAEVLKHPGDGFSRNYVIKQQNPTTTQIVSVDNSQMFVEPIVKTSVHSRQKHKELQERSIIYCLPPIMQTPLDERALNTITAIRDVAKLLTAWLKTVESREANYTAFLTKEDIKQWNAQRKKNNPFIPHALFRTGAISLLAMQLRYLQSLFRFREQRSKKIIIKPTLVMNKLNPRVLKYYTAINKKPGHQALTHEAAFKKATGAVQSMSSSEATRAILGDVPDRTSIQQQFNQLKETAKMSSLVHKAQDELNYLGEQLLADLKDKQAFNITDEGDWELRVDFQPPREKLSKKRSSVRRRKHSHKAETSPKANTQPVTAKLQNLTLGQKEWLNTLLVKRATFKTLVLSHCIGLDDAILFGLIKNCQRLAYLDITGCQQITQESLRELANHCKELRILKASRTGIVDATRETGLFQSSRLLHFPKLNKLHLSDCAQKKASRPIIRLTRIALDAPELETLKSSHNPSLRSVELPNAINLTDLNLENNGQQTQLKTPAEATLITLNIAGCKLLTEEQLTFNSSLLTTLNIEGCSLLAHSDFRQQYPSLFTALSWPHYTESFVETLSTTLGEALTTKGETIQWNQLPIKTRETLHGALYAWGQAGQIIIPALLKALKFKEGDVDHFATQALAKCHEHLSGHIDSVIPALLKALKNNIGYVRDNAAQALGKCHEHLSGHVDSVISTLLNALKDKDEDVRKSAAKALAQCAQHHQDSVIPTLLNALMDNDGYVRNSTAQALAKCAQHHQDSVIPALLNALMDNDWHVRNSTAQALAQCHEHLSGYVNSVIPTLLNTLMDKEKDVRKSAAKALTKCAQHHQDSVIPLLTALKDKDEDVRKSAAQALAKCHEHLSEYVDSVIPALLIALKDDDLNVRDSAAQALAQCAQHYQDSIIPALLIALKDNRGYVRESAAQALAQCHKYLSGYIDSVIPALLIALKDNNWDVRQSTAQALAKCHEHLSEHIDSVIPALLITLKDKNWDVRQSTAQALAQCHEHLSGYIDSVIPAFIIALKDNNRNVRHSTALALARCHEHLSGHIDSVIPALLTTLKDKERYVRHSAAKALAQCAQHHQDSVTPLLTALKDNNWYVRKSATQALAQCQEHLSRYIDSVIPALLNALKDKDEDVRHSAAQALAKCHEHLSGHIDSVIPALLTTLKDKERYVRHSAAQALALCHEHLSEHIDSVIPALLTTLKDKERYVRHSTAKALAQCAQHHQDSVIPLLTALKDKDEDVRHSATQALAQCQEHLSGYIDSVIPALLNALKDKDEDVRHSATQALAKCHEYLSGHIDSVIPALLTTLKDKERYVRHSAAQALALCHEHLSGHIDSVIPALLTTLKDKERYVRHSAAKALAQCAQHHQDSVISELLNALKDNNESVRHSAALALAKCAQHHQNSVIPALLIALKDNNWRIRQSAAQAFTKCYKHLSGYIDSITPTLLITLKDDYSDVRHSAIQALGTIGSIHTLQSWIKNVFNEYSVNLESEKTSQQEPTPDNAAPYSSIVTQQASTLLVEPPICYNDSQNSPEDEVQHETAYCNNEI